MIHKYIDKSLFLSKCYIFRHYDRTGYTSGNTIGFPNPCFGFILAGTGVFTASDRTIELFPGDLVFIPKGQIYTSVWKATPELIFYSLNFEFASESATSHMYEFSKIHAPELKITFDRLYNSSGSDGGDNLVALSAFYEILSVTDKRFRKAEIPRYSEIGAAVEYIEAHCTEEISVPHLAKLCCMSQSKFYNLFRKTVGYTPTDYKNLIKVRRAEELIVRGKLTLEEICDICGFSSPSYLRRVYRKFTGRTPKETRRSADII
ncbi:MAG: helix-turn-helix transcriptional regulator [Clostridia bacterium]|nr:helix-turn-helix transcriptional regulator [Clostridia bacterium]